MLKNASFPSDSPVHVRPELLHPRLLPSQEPLRIGVVEEVEPDERRHGRAKPRLGHRGVLRQGHPLFEERNTIIVKQEKYWPFLPYRSDDAVDEISEVEEDEDAPDDEQEAEERRQSWNVGGTLIGSLLGAGSAKDPESSKFQCHRRMGMIGDIQCALKKKFRSSSYARATQAENKIPFNILYFASTLMEALAEEGIAWSGLPSQKQHVDLECSSIKSFEHDIY